MPGVVIEAFCAATPVVTSDWRYMSEVVDHGHNGLVIGLQNFSHDAAELLVGALAEETYLQYSRNSLLTAQHKYSEKAAEAILEGIDGMVS